MLFIFRSFSINLLFLLLGSSAALTLVRLGSSQYVGGVVVPASAGGGDASSFKDNFHRGYETRDAAASSSVDANAVDRVFDRSQDAKKQAKTALIGNGFGGLGGGSAGSEQQSLSSVFDRGSLSAENLSERKNAETASRAHSSSGDSKGFQRAEYGLGHGLYGAIPAVGASDKALQKRRRTDDVSRSNSDRYYKDAGNRVEKFDKGELSTASGSAASIHEGGFGGLYGSQGAEDAELFRKRTRGVVGEKTLAEGAEKRNAIDRSHDAQEVVRLQGSRSALGGPYGTLGHANAAELVKFDRGTLSHEGVDAFDKAAYERTKNIVADQDRASSSARVSIGEGLHGLGGSRGEAQSSALSARDGEYEKAAGLKLKAKSASSTVRTFDTGARQAKHSNAAAFLPHVVLAGGHY